MDLEKVVTKVIELAELMLPEAKITIENTGTSDRLFLVKFSETYSEHMDFRDMMHQLMATAEDYQNTEGGHEAISDFISKTS